MRKLSELLNELYQAYTDKEKYAAVQSLIKALSSFGVSQEEAVEFVRSLVLLIYEHQRYKTLVEDLKVVFSDFQSAFSFFEKQDFGDAWDKVLESLETDLQKLRG